MPTLWIECVEVMPPSDTGGLDASSRAVWSTNVMVFKRPSGTFQQEVLSVLTAASVGTLGTTIFVGSKAVLPTGPGPYLVIWAYGGLSGVRTHDVTSGPAYERPTVQLRSHALNPAAAEAMCRAAYAALVGIRNTSVTPT
jgi:hypothetical protein